MKFFLYDETMMNTKAKITTEKLAAMSDIVSQKAQYITAAGAATPNQITIAAGVLIAVGSSAFKTVLTNLTTANLDTGSGFEMGTDYYIYCCDPTNGYPTPWTATKFLQFPKIPLTLPGTQRTTAERSVVSITGSVAM